MDGNGTKVVEYTYDAWGKLISTTGTLATSLGADNPFRYRGYYYDTETGLYYLMTRYYDPEVCRFISADVYMTTGQGVLGGNMWAYCLNNPILYSDTLGESVTVCILGVTFTLVELLVIGVAVAVVADILINGEEALVMKAAEGVAEAVETIAQIWQVEFLSHRDMASHRDCSNSSFQYRIRDYSCNITRCGFKSVRTLCVL